jgi:hypothetical protein
LESYKPSCSARVSVPEPYRTLSGANTISRTRLSEEEEAGSPQQGAIRVAPSAAALLASSPEGVSSAGEGRRRQCQLEGCTEWAVGGTLHCEAHGAGRRVESKAEARAGVAAAAAVRNPLRVSLLRRRS